MAKGIAAINQCLRCAPQAVAETKRLVRASLAGPPLGAVLDEASSMFAAALAGEAREGILAFTEKRRPAWAEKIERL
jgi:isohexenylglutaconyl-CoA hydratase